MLKNISIANMYMYVSGNFCSFLSLFVFIHTHHKHTHVYNHFILFASDQTNVNVWQLFFMVEMLQKKNNTQTHTHNYTSKHLKHPFHLLHQIENSVAFYHVQFSTHKLEKSFMMMMCILWCC